MRRGLSMLRLGCAGALLAPGSSGNGSGLTEKQLVGAVLCRIQQDLEMQMWRVRALAALSPRSSRVSPGTRRRPRFGPSIAMRRRFAYGNTSCCRCRRSITTWLPHHGISCGRWLQDTDRIPRRCPGERPPAVSPRAEGSRPLREIRTRRGSETGCMPHRAAAYTSSLIRRETPRRAETRPDRTGAGAHIRDPRCPCRPSRLRSPRKP